MYSDYLWINFKIMFHLNDIKFKSQGDFDFLGQRGLSVKNRQGIPASWTNINKHENSNDIVKVFQI